MSLVKRFLKFKCVFCSRPICSVSNTYRVRFAPSPTGGLHLGGLRTALYNYLFAKRHRGAFILRIEDTDQKRKVPGAVQHIEEMLTWTGIIPDEGPSCGGLYGPYIQSERLHMYKAAAEELINKGAAYRCFCMDRQLEFRRKEALRNHQTPCYDNRCRFLTKEQISEKLSLSQPFTVRFKLKDESLTFHDMVHGLVTMNVSLSEGDPIILKSDGYPTYHLANVVDDHLMNVTHVLRGMEWQISTFKHIMMYDAFSWSAPCFAHLPLILNSDGTKLSKRQGDIQIEHLKDAGYFPEAVLSFVVQVGGIDHNQHSLSLQNLIDQFELKNINSNSCRMEEKLLDICNQRHLAEYLSNDEKTGMLIEEMKKLLCTSTEKEGTSFCVKVPSDDHIRKVLLYHKNIISNVVELLQKNNSYLWMQPTLKLSDIQHLGVETAKTLKEIVSDLQQFVKDKPETLISAIRLTCEKQGVKFSHCMKLLRKILCDVKDGPPIIDVIHLLGLQESISRVQLAIKLLETEQASSILDQSKIVHSPGQLV